MKFNLLHSFFLISQIILSQNTNQNININGNWINKKNGIKIEEDKFVMLEKKDTWIISIKKEDIYYFIGNPISKSYTTFEIWVANTKLNKEYINGNYENINSQQFRIVKFELKKNGKLKFYISNVLRIYETDLKNIYLHGIKPNEGYINSFVFEKLIEN